MVVQTEPRLDMLRIREVHEFKGSLLVSTEQRLEAGDPVVLDTVLMDVPLVEGIRLLQADVVVHFIALADGSVVPHLILPIRERYIE